MRSVWRVCGTVSFVLVLRVPWGPGVGVEGPVPVGLARPQPGLEALRAAA